MSNLSLVGEISVYARSVQQKLEQIKATEIPAAHVRALNRTATSGRAQVARQIASAIKLPQRKVKGRMFIRKAKPRDLVANIRVYSRGLTAISLPGVRDKGRYKKGVRGRVGTGVSARGGHQFPGAWIGKAPKGGKQVFWRNLPNIYTKKQSIGVARVEIERDARKITPRVLRLEMKNNYSRRYLAELEYRLNKHRA